MPGLQTEEVRVICAWCDVAIRGPENAEEVSHGICADCRRQVLKNLGRREGGRE